VSNSGGGCETSSNRGWSGEPPVFLQHFFQPFGAVAGIVVRAGEITLGDGLMIGCQDFEYLSG
jgi:hypothetical protein